MEMTCSILLLFVVLLFCFGSVKSSGDDSIESGSGSGSGDNDTTTSTYLTTTNQPDIVYNTSVEVQIADTLTDGKITFYCEFDLYTNESLWYKVNWKIGNSVVETLGPFNSNVREQSKLLETSLTGTTTVGFDILCAYEVARTIDGTYSTETTSPKKFVGIQILSTSVSVSGGGKADITLQATAPIGCNSGETCSLGINIYNRNYSSSCYQPSTTFSECQVQLKADEWNKPFNLSVTSGINYRYGTRTSVNTIKLQTQSGFSSHTLWADYDVGTVDVSPTQSTTETEGKYCYAVCDPHMGTFEHEHYEHQYEGKFTLYENKEWKQEIQIQTQSCFPWSNGPPFCVCGLAIRAGKEVYIMDKCSPRAYWKIQYDQCDPTRSGLINAVVQYSSQYSITLPSGTVVKTNLYPYGKFLNLYVYPSEGDVNNTEGLCGRVGDPGFYHRNGSMEQNYIWSGMPDYSTSWSVDDDVLDLFDASDREKLDPIGNSGFQCKCAKDPSGLSQVVCDQVDISQCTIYFGRWRKVDDCKTPFTNIRKKRSIQQSVRNERTFVAEPHTLVKRDASDGYAGNWSEVTATNYCESLFTNSSAVKACADVPGVDLESPKNNCIVDIKLAGDTSFALTAIETIRNKCFKEVGQNSTLQNSTDGSISIMDKVKNGACPFDCSGNGNCLNGTCICESDFASDDCSMDRKKRPIGVVEYGEGKGLCDLGSCSEISVSGGPFIDGGSAQCLVISNNLLTNGSLVYQNNMTSNATVISIGEVSCPLATTGRRKRAAGDPEIEEVTVYEVSVSNGGLYSESNLIVARHVDCHSCNVNSTSVACTYTGCYSGGECYQENEKLKNDPCFLCNINDGEPVWERSISDGNCTETSHPDEGEDDLLWVIGAVLGAVVVIVIIVVIVVVIVKKKNKRPITPILPRE